MWSNIKYFDCTLQRFFLDFFYSYLHWYMSFISKLGFVVLWYNILM